MVSSIIKICPKAEELSVVRVNIPCPVDGCTSILPHAGSLRIHLSKTHRINEDGTEEKSGADQNAIKQYHCPVQNCVYNISSKRHFTSKKLLKQHYMKVHADKKHKCPKCGQGFGLERDCRRHQQTCGIIFRCKTCDCPFSSVEATLNHCNIKQHEVPEECKNFRSSKVPTKTQPQTILILQTALPPTPSPNLSVKRNSSNTGTSLLRPLLPKPVINATILPAPKTIQTSQLTSPNPILIAPFEKSAPAVAVGSRSISIQTDRETAEKNLMAMAPSLGVGPMVPYRLNPTHQRPKLCRNNTQTDCTFLPNQGRKVGKRPSKNSNYSLNKFTSSTGIQTAVSVPPVKKKSHLNMVGTQTVGDYILTTAMSSAQIPIQRISQGSQVNPLKQRAPRNNSVESSHTQTMDVQSPPRWKKRRRTSTQQDDQDGISNSENTPNFLLLKRTGSSGELTDNHTQTNLSNSAVPAISTQTHMKCLMNSWSNGKSASENGPTFSTQQSTETQTISSVLQRMMAKNDANSLYQISNPYDQPNQTLTFSALESNDASNSEAPCNNNGNNLVGVKSSLENDIESAMQTEPDMSLSYPPLTPEPVQTSLPPFSENLNQDADNSNCASLLNTLTEHHTSTNYDAPAIGTISRQSQSSGSHPVKSKEIVRESGTESPFGSFLDQSNTNINYEATAIGRISQQSQAPISKSAKENITENSTDSPFGNFINQSLSSNKCSLPVFSKANSQNCSLNQFQRLGAIAHQQPEEDQRKPQEQNGDRSSLLCSLVDKDPILCSNSTFPDIGDSNDVPMGAFDSVRHFASTGTSPLDITDSSLLTFDKGIGTSDTAIPESFLLQPSKTNERRFASTGTSTLNIADSTLLTFERGIGTSDHGSSENFLLQSSKAEFSNKDTNRHSGIDNIANKSFFNSSNSSSLLTFEKGIDTTDNGSSESFLLQSSETGYNLKKDTNQYSGIDTAPKEVFFNSSVRNVTETSLITFDKGIGTSDNVGLGINDIANKSFFNPPIGGTTETRSQSCKVFMDTSMNTESDFLNDQLYLNNSRADNTSFRNKLFNNDENINDMVNKSFFGSSLGSASEAHSQCGKVFMNTSMNTEPDFPSNLFNNDKGVGTDPCLSFSASNDPYNISTNVLTNSSERRNISTCMDDFMDEASLTLSGPNSDPCQNKLFNSDKGVGTDPCLGLPTPSTSYNISNNVLANSPERRTISTCMDDLMDDGRLTLSNTGCGSLMSSQFAPLVADIEVQTLALDNDFEALLNNSEHSRSSVIDMYTQTVEDMLDLFGNTTETQTTVDDSFFPGLEFSDIETQTTAGELDCLENRSLMTSGTQTTLSNQNLNKDVEFSDMETQTGFNVCDLDTFLTDSHTQTTFDELEDFLSGLN